MAKKKKKAKKKKRKAELKEKVELKKAKLKEKEKEKKQREKAKLKKPIKAFLAGETISSNTKEAMELYGTSRFGELIEGKILYSLVEALFLAEKGKLEVYQKKKKLKFDELMYKALEIDKRIGIKYIVFKNMRNRGYIIKTALKFGAEFRVYDRGKKPGEKHARWILYPVHESSELTWHEFAAKNRVAHSTRKNLLIAIVDEEKDVTFYEVRWTRP